TNASTGSYRIDAGSSLTISADAAVDHDGLMVVNGTLTNQGGLSGSGDYLGDGVLITGGGLVVEGNFNPGASEDTIGSMEVTGPLTLSGTSALHLQLAGNGVNDAVTVSDLFTLNGVIEVGLLGGYEATAGHSFNLLDFTSSDFTGY